jgi:drug/metabolite transporter (DMT)-like permease
MDKDSQHPTSSGALGRNQAQGLAGVSVASVIWGSTALFARWSGAQPLAVVFWRVAFASVALLAYVLVRRELGLLLRIGRRRVLGLLFLALMLVLGWDALFTAYTYTSVGTAILLNYVGPVFVAALTPLVTHVPSDRRIALPLALAVVGTAIIVGPQAFGGAGSRNLLGILLAFFSALTYAASVLVTKRLLVGVPGGLVAFTQQAAAAIVLLPAVFLVRGPASVTGWGSLVILGVVHSGLAWLLFFKGLKVVRADRVAVLTYVEPVSAVIFAGLFLAEPVRWYTVLGGAAVIAGGLLVARLGALPSPEGPAVPVPAVVETAEMVGEE